jgi:hypothetical protein
MHKNATVFVMMFVVAVCVGCADAQRSSDAAWGETKNGLRCRLVTERLPAGSDPLVMDNPFNTLVVEIQNVGKNTQTFPALIPRTTALPVIELCIVEEPKVKSPSSSGDPRQGSIQLKPGEMFKCRLSDGYIVAYGTWQKETSWVRFKPTRRTYRLSVKVQVTDQDWIASGTIAFSPPVQKENAEPTL